MTFGTLWRRLVAWRASGVEYRKERRDWVRDKLRTFGARWSLGRRLILGAVGLAAGVASGQIAGVWIAVIVALAPIVALILGAWAWYRLRAPGALYRKYKDHFNAHQSGSPLTAAGRVEGDGITFELVPVSNGLPPPDITVDVDGEVTVYVVFKDGLTSRLKQVPTPGSISTGSTLKVCYPDDFDHTRWPLGPGTYHAVWQYRLPDNGGHFTQGWDFKIRGWGSWRRR